MALSATAPAHHQPLSFAIQTTDDDGTLMTLRSSHDATEAHLDQLVQAFQDAINHRQLSLKAPIWRHLHSSYRMTDLSITPIRKGAPPTLEEKFREIAKLCKVHPDYGMYFSSNTSEVDESRGRARTLTALKVVGTQSHLSLFMFNG